jgi:glycosyltransferase involved in cell wall biosynthesis
MEAMANGLVVLSSNVGAISESILNKENGYLIDYSSNDQMLIEFCEILRKQNENELTYISKNAIAHSKKYFDLNLFQKKYRAIFSN